MKTGDIVRIKRRRGQVWQTTKNKICVLYDDSETVYPPWELVDKDKLIQKT